MNIELTQSRTRPTSAARPFAAAAGRTETRARRPRVLDILRTGVDDVAAFRTEALFYFLRGTDTFRDLPEKDIRELAAAATTKSLKKGDYLFHRGEPAPGLCIVRRGVVNFHRVAMDGREIAIHFYRELETLPAVAVHDGIGCPADARAVVQSDVVIIPRRAFLARVRTCPEMALRMFSAMEHQVQQLANSLEDISSKNASTRFVQWLLRRCECTGLRKSVVVDVGTTKRALASELGVRQETLSRTLRQLTESGHLQVCGRSITITNPAALRDEWGADIACPEAA